MKKFQNILTLSPNHCGPLHDSKTSNFFSYSFSRCNFEKLIRTLIEHLKLKEHLRVTLSGKKINLKHQIFQEKSPPPPYNSTIPIFLWENKLLFDFPMFLCDTFLYFNI